MPPDAPATEAVVVGPDAGFAAVKARGEAALAAATKAAAAGALQEIADGTDDPPSSLESSLTNPPPPAKGERGKDGKFLPKEEPTLKDGKPLPTKGKPPSPDDGKGDPYPVKHARDLLKAGETTRAADALLKTIGLSLETLKPASKEFATLRKERHELNSERQKLQSEVAGVKQFFAPFAKAMSAVHAGDMDAMAEALGQLPLPDGSKRGWKNMGDLSKDGLKSFATTDPEVRRLRENQQRLEQQLRERDTQAEQARQADAVRVAQTQYVESIREELTGSGDEQLEWASSKPAFVRRTFEILQENYDGGDTIPKLEAARLAWEEMYGDEVNVRGRDADRDGAGKKPGNREVADQGSRSPVKPAGGSKGRSSTSLRQDRAAEAAPPRDLKPGSPELMDYFKNRMATDVLRENLEASTE